MATGRRSKGRARQDLVVSAAVEVITERGLAGVRISDVAERAGMTPGHVTYYFPTKNALLMSAIRRSEEAFTARLAEQLTAIDDPWHRLERFVDLAAAAGQGHQGWLLWFEVWSQAALDPQVAEVHAELDARSRAVLAGVVRHGVRRGAFQVDDPDRAALLLSAVVDGLSIQLTLGAAGLDAAAVRGLCLQAARALLAG